MSIVVVINTFTFISFLLLLNSKKKQKENREIVGKMFIENKVTK